MLDKAFDLRIRTRKFGENIVRLCSKYPNSPVINPLISQLVKAGTSVGANYCEADNAESSKDFKHKIGIVKKEASESEFFLGLLIIADESLATESAILKTEAEELHLIFCKIFSKLP